MQVFHWAPVRLGLARSASLCRPGPPRSSQTSALLCAADRRSRRSRAGGPAQTTSAKYVRVGRDGPANWQGGSAVGRGCTAEGAKQVVLGGGLGRALGRLLQWWEARTAGWQRCSAGGQRPGQGHSPQPVQGPNRGKTFGNLLCTFDKSKLSVLFSATYFLHAP